MREPSTLEPTNVEGPARRLERLWREGGRPDADAFLAQVGPLSFADLVTVLLVDQRERWQRGERVPAEDYLCRHPDLHGDDECALDLVYGEYLVRRERGECPRVEEYLGRFPQYAKSFRLQVELCQALDSADPAPTLDRNGEATRNPSGGERLLDVSGYEVLSLLGRGGMGVIYKARQIALKRIVALKMLLAGPHAGPDQLARFRAEAEAVARLQHPNIVQIHEVSEQDGRPYLCLEFLDAGSLKQRLAGTPQPLAESARLVETLARAIHHAHQHGVVHRDLKPANILLASGGRKPPGPDAQINDEVLPGDVSPPLADLVPKITDFGLAKLLSSDETAGTQTGAILGTPAYMAPEQAAGQAHAVGPATDTYALGAVLYELLTGRPPFQGATHVATLQQVTALEPLPPSRLRRDLPRDLETICLKCLQKEPGKRYADAHELADDLRRFQAGEPIRARPVSPAGRLWRWCRRNKLAAALAAVAALALTGGLAGVTGMWLRADRLRREAETSRDEARINLQHALDTVEQFCTKVSEDRRLQERDLRALRRQLLQTAVDFHTKFVEQHGHDPARRAELARAYFRLGRLTAEIDTRPQAIRFYEQALALFEQLTRDHPDDAGYHQELAQTSSKLGELYAATGEKERAEAAFRRVLEIAQRLVEEDPDQPAGQRLLADGHNQLGNFYSENGRAAEAEAPLKEALARYTALVRAYPDVATYRREHARSQFELGHLYHYRFIRRWREAEAAYKAALDLQKEVVQLDPTNPDDRASVARILRDLGKVNMIAKRDATAEAVFKEGVQAQEELVREHTSVAGYQKTLACLYDDLGRLFETTGRTSDAEAPWNNARKIWEQLARQDPSETYTGANLGRSQMWMGVVAHRKGDLAVALDWFDCSIRTLEDVHHRDAKRVSIESFLSNAYEHRARVLNALARYADALRDWDQVLRHELAPMRPWYQMERARTLALLGDHARAAREVKEVVEDAPSPPQPARFILARAARVYSLCADAILRDTGPPAAERTALADHYAGAAVKLLRKAVTVGFAAVDQLDKEKDFAALRPRPDFQELVRGLRAKTSSK